MNMVNTGLVLRELNGVAELKHAEWFQKEVWGKDDPPDNSDLMLAIQHEGGLVAGAFKDGRMLGFLFGFPTSQPHIQHSHRLAVHPDSRGMGLGVKLKWFQRDWCLARGITLVRWTFDPLRRINANLNIARLGGTASTYYQDYYGEMVGINAGIPSDRLLVDWSLTAPRVEALAKDGQAAVCDTVENALTLEIPENLDNLLASNLEVAVSERLRVREEMASAFTKGYKVVGFDAETCCYLLTSC
ncbi:GNAT family N-acetyltransferase [Phaeobacter italicus]|jgi:predicted GNAT superfamily acetyltransferase|uniref:GNAT family N-acetyltransferase n=1 Tax=Phaeobacter italicus TaxID=481446 RepID=UPI00242B43BE|nr:GNAT family N-acetyltransferase [Phaeobacter italicus]MCI5099891.1 GNAT family N-acetyltransferase [Phaeobacter italicus]